MAGGEKKVTAPSRRPAVRVGNMMRLGEFWRELRRGNTGEFSNKYYGSMVDFLIRLSDSNLPSIYVYKRLRVT